MGRLCLVVQSPFCRRLVQMLTRLNAHKSPFIAIARRAVDMAKTYRVTNLQQENYTVVKHFYHPKFINCLSFTTQIEFVTSRHHSTPLSPPLCCNPQRKMKRVLGSSGQCDFVGRSRHRKIVMEKSFDFPVLQTCTIKRIF